MSEESTIHYDPNARYDIETIEVTVREDGDVVLPATLFKPRNPGPFPALVRVHGGAWNVGQRQDKELIDRALAQSGIVVLAIEHRLAPEYPYPAQVLDTNHAIRWLKLHAAEYSIDPKHIGGAGDSSGGHTMLLNAMFPTDPVYNSIPLTGSENLNGSVGYVIAMWSVLDPYTRYFYAVDTGRDDIVERTDNYFHDMDEMKRANPQMILERGQPECLPPIIIIQGDTDDNIPNYIPMMFVDAYQAAGGEVRIEWFPKMAHSFAADAGPETDRAIEFMRLFIASQLSK